MGSFVARCTRAVGRQIASLESGTGRLHVPGPLGERRRIPDAPFHTHPELFLQIAGTTVFTFPEERLVLEPGSVCIVPRLLPHAERVHASSEPFSNLVVMCASGLSVHLAAESPIQRGRPFVEDARRFEQVDSDPYADELDRIALAARKEIESPLHGRAALHRTIAFLYQLLILFRRDDRASPRADGRGHPLVAQARTQVMLNLSDPKLSVARLAGWLGCSPDYLSHLFHRETGERLSRFVNRHRLVRAEGLLRSSTLTVSEVAWASGYDDPAYFSRLFRAARGCSPRQYRAGRPDG